MSLNLINSKNKIVILLFVMLPIFAFSSPKYEYDLIIKHVKLFDGNNVTTQANIYVKNGLIQRIDSNSDVINVSSKYKIDGKNKTLIPGLINAHTHPQSRNDLGDAAKAGIMTVMDLLRIVEDSIPVFKSLNKSAMYADYYTSGIGADMPHAVIQFYINQVNPWAPLTIQEVQDFVEERIKNKVDFIKIFQDSRLPEKFSDSLFDQLIHDVHKNNLIAIVHAEILRDARYAFNHGANILAHGWVDSLITKADLENWKQREFYVIPTLLVHIRGKKNVNAKSSTLSESAMIAEIGKIHKAGIRLLAGSDSPADHLNFTTDFYKELALYVEAGLSPMDALKTATIYPAQAFKLKDKGIIKEGISADFILIDGDLLSDISKLNSVEAVWKKGIRIK